jgi:hypothetical protein
MPDEAGGADRPGVARRRACRVRPVIRSSSALATGLAALAATGCGSTSTKTGPAHTATSAAALETHTATDHLSQRPTKAQFIGEADAICRTLKSEQAPLKARVRALNASSENLPAAYKALAPLLRQSVGFARTADSKLQALPKPPGDAGRIEKLLTGYSEEAADVTNFADALGKEERGAWEASEKALAKALARDRGLARGYGFKVCGTSE